MFFKDPSGNNLEFKAMTTPDNLFTKYNVVDNPVPLGPVRVDSSK
jgi:hypothetical protein